MSNLRDRVAIITGASRGIGRAVALRFGAAGATVVAAARADHADAVVAEIREAGGTAIPLSVTPTQMTGVWGGPCPWEYIHTPNLTLSPISTR